MTDASDEAGVNERFVGVDHEQGGSWNLALPGSVSVRAATDRTLDIYEGLLAACEGVLRPVDIEYAIRFHTDDGPGDARDRPKTGSFDHAERRSHTDPEGVSTETVREEIQRARETDEYVVYLPGIEFERVQTRVALNSFDGWVDKHDEAHTRGYHLYRLSGTAPVHPNGLGISHTSPPAGLREEYDSVHWVKVRCYTELPFTDTSVGQRNRERLRCVFDRLWKRFEPVQLLLDRRSLSEAEMLSVVPDIEDSFYLTD